MTLSSANKIFGLHSLTMYDRTTFEPFGIMKILGSLALNMTGSLIDLTGGSFRFPWASVPGVIIPELSGTIKEFGVNGELFEKFLGASVVTTAAEPSGNVGTLTDRKGTLVDATTGVASIAATSGSEVDLKTSVYIVKAVSATTVDVFAMSDQDFAKGADKVFENDDLKITATPLTVPGTSGTVDVPGFGLEITGGSGTVALTIGDTASVLVRKINTGSQVISIGSSTSTFPLFGAFVTSDLQEGGGIMDAQLFKCQAQAGLPIALSEMAWIGTDIVIRPLYDDAINKVMDYRIIRG